MNRNNPDRHIQEIVFGMAVQLRSDLTESSPDPQDRNKAISWKQFRGKVMHIIGWSESSYAVVEHLGDYNMEFISGHPSDLFERIAPESTADESRSEYAALRLASSGRFIVDQDRRKVAEMYQPGDSPAEMEAIKRRIVGSFNALPDLVGVLMRADKEGGLWQALCNEGITDSYDAALASAVKALGEAGIVEVALRAEIDPDRVRAKAEQ